MIGEGLTFQNGVMWADYILENTEGPEGMVETWRYQCVIRRATYGMLVALKERYDELCQASITD